MIDSLVRRTCNRSTRGGPRQFGSPTLVFKATIPVLVATLRAMLTNRLTGTTEATATSATNTQTLRPGRPVISQTPAERPIFQSSRSSAQRKPIADKLKRFVFW